MFEEFCVKKLFKNIKDLTSVMYTTGVQSDPVTLSPLVKNHNRWEK